MPRPVIMSPQRNSFTLRDGAFSTTAPRMGLLRWLVPVCTSPSPPTGLATGFVSKAATDCPRKRRRFICHGGALDILKRRRLCQPLRFATDLDHPSEMTSRLTLAARGTIGDEDSWLEMAGLLAEERKPCRLGRMFLGNKPQRPLFQDATGGSPRPYTFALRCIGTAMSVRLDLSPDWGPADLERKEGSSDKSERSAY